MAGVNKVILLGRVGQEPEVKDLENGSKVVNFSLATTESYKNKEGQKVDNTEWHDLELWEGLAKVAQQYVKQGDLIYVEGKIKSNVWQDKEGNNRKKQKIRVTTMTMMPKGTGEKQAPQNQPSPIDVSTGGGAVENSDELPF